DVELKKDYRLPAAFGRSLRALSRQGLKRGDGPRWIGPLRFGTPRRKRPSREVVLTILLAHLFDRVASHHGHGALAINKGREWAVAAELAAATLGSDVVGP